MHFLRRFQGIELISYLSEIDVRKFIPGCFFDVFLIIYSNEIYVYLFEIPDLIIGLDNVKSVSLLI